MRILKQQLYSRGTIDFLGCSSVFYWLFFGFMELYRWSNAEDLITVMF